MKVLVAEDDRISRSILCAALTHWGYQPVVAADGQEALQAMQEQDPPRLLILDWHMPHLNGLDVCKLLRQEPTEDPPYVIIVTSRGRTEDIVTGLGAGANDYLAKPYENEELRARLLSGQRVLDLQARLLEANRLLEYRATHDTLTGVLARGALLEALDRELARGQRSGGRLSLGMCDLDRFKNVNDTYGHQTGDQVLIDFARCLQANLRPYDLVGRYGGEEFLVLAPHHGTGDEALFERLRRRVAEHPVCAANGTIGVTVSIGVTSCGGDDGAAAAIAAADQALYDAKAAGRNRVCYRRLPSREERAA